MNMEKRALLAFVIAMVIILAYPRIIANFFPQLKEQTKISQVTIGKRPQAPLAEEVKQEIKQPAKQAEGPAQPHEKEINFENPEYGITLSNVGGVIKKIVLKKHLDAEGKPIVLAAVAEPGDSIFSVTGLDPELDAGLPFTFTEKPDRVIFTAGTKSGLSIEKEIIFQKDKYAIELRQTIANRSDKPLDLKYRVAGGTGITSLMPQDEMYVEVIRDVSGKISNVNKKSIKNETTWEGGYVDWVSLKNRYFSLILKAPVSFSTVYSKVLQDKELQTGIGISSLNLKPNFSVTQDFVLYAGPNEHDKISALKLGMEDSLHLGVTGAIGRWLFVIMNFFYGLLRNWGVAIIVLTILMNVALFPLTFKSLKSMKQMQAIQPKIGALRKTYKDNPQKLNKEIMEIYKKYKISPLGGCLPMLFQMPIFFALYQVLMRSIELRGAPFLWIKDLSQPDRLIPNIPLFPNELNILPLLMAAAMFLQQKLSTPPVPASSDTADQMAQQQKMMAVMMPVLFGILFYKLPSGLVLYWLTNTILTIVEQGMFLKPHMFHVEHSES